jgi:hypothetical protein
MVFEDIDTCRFNIIKNTNGFQLLFFEDADVEHKVYRRYRADGNMREAEREK